MSDYVFTPPAQPRLPIRDSAQMFPVRRVYCVGRNYAAHAIEMGHDPNKELPFFFQKNSDNVYYDSNSFPYPSASSNVHHEVELVVALSSGGENIMVEDALNHVYGYAVGLDMTRRDLQGEAKQAGRPWEVGKAFEYSAPMGEVVPAETIGHPQAGLVQLSINGEVKQEGDLNQLIWKVPEVIAYLSSLFTLAPGDLIMTGTPAGVGPVQKGDHMVATIESVGSLKISVT